MVEWSNTLALGANLFGGAGSNPASDIIIFNAFMMIKKNNF